MVSDERARASNFGSIVDIEPWANLADGEERKERASLMSFGGPKQYVLANQHRPKSPEEKASSKNTLTPKVIELEDSTFKSVKLEEYTSDEAQSRVERKVILESTVSVPIEKPDTGEQIEERRTTEIESEDVSEQLDAEGIEEFKRLFRENEVKIKLD